MSTTETAKTAEKKIINFNENVNFGQALYAIIPNACSSYTITGIIISITLVLIVLITIYALYELISNGKINEAFWLIIVTTITSLLTIWTNAHLKKGCEASKLIKEYKDYLSEKK